MPELPEVETVLKVLEKKIKNKTIRKVEVYHSKMIQNITVEQFKTALINETFIGFERLGKNIILELNNYYLVSHLRMEGKYFLRFNTPLTKHDHVIFYFDNSYLAYNDTRKFGTFHLYSKDETIQCLQNYGEDALCITQAQFYEKVKNKKTTLKNLLLDQSNISGIGNIYADEIIYLSKMHPSQPTETISKRKYYEILQNTKIVLNRAIQAGGTTIRTYTSDYEIDGRFQLSLNVHMQKQCPKCFSPISKIKVAQRGTYICPKCQKIK